MADHDFAEEQTPENLSESEAAEAFQVARGGGASRPLRCSGRGSTGCFPGFGVVDSGCGKTLMGEQTLHEMEGMLGGRKVIRSAHSNSFRFGNGQSEDSETVARIPAAINGQTGLIQAAVIRGRAPLLLGRPTLEKLRMSPTTLPGSSTTQVRLN